MLPTKLQVNWPFGSGEEVKKQNNFSYFQLASTKYKESYCSHPGRPRARAHSHHAHSRQIVQVFQMLISQQSLTTDHSYLEHGCLGESSVISKDLWVQALEWG